jgi:uncharacterized protein YndB with AHSA1/START domain
MSAEDVDDIVVECELPDPPEKVWRALTEPALIDAWLVQGDPAIECEVIEAEPETSVRYRWRDGGGVASEVRIEIAPSADGTHFRLVHSAVEVLVLLAFPRRMRASKPSGRRMVMRTELKWAA